MWRKNTGKPYFDTEDFKSYRRQYEQIFYGSRTAQKATEYSEEVSRDFSNKEKKSDVDLSSYSGKTLDCDFHVITDEEEKRCHALVPKSQYASVVGSKPD